MQQTDEDIEIINAQVAAYENQEIKIMDTMCKA